MLLGRLREALSALEIEGHTVLVAVSGGVDSTVLLHALHEVAASAGLRLAVGHVNHRLRGAASERDEQAVRVLADRLGVEFRCVEAHPEVLRSGKPSSARPTVQEAARRLRYQALESMARELECHHIATGHNANDQAETVLLRLLRGTGPTGLGGIPERSPDGRIVRPFLGVTRDVIETFARHRGLIWREDASNRSNRYPRNRIRGRWLPALAQEFNPGLLRALADLAEAQRRENEWIEGLVDRAAADRFTFSKEALWIETKDWADLPEALARRLLRRAMHRVGGGRGFSRVHLDRALRFLSEGRRGTRVEFPGGLTLERIGPGVRLAGPRSQSPATC